MYVLTQYESHMSYGRSGDLKEVTGGVSKSGIVYAKINFDTGETRKCAHANHVQGSIGEMEQYAYEILKQCAKARSIALNKLKAGLKAEEEERLKKWLHTDDRVDAIDEQLEALESAA